MAKSDARFEYKANLSRTDHELSQPFTFTSAPGMLLPIWFDIASPGDSYYMSHDLPLLRSQVLAAPAMVDVKVHFETFFVPIQMIYEPFENSKFQIKNLRSAFYDPATLRDNLLPVLPYGVAVNEVLGTYFNSSQRVDCFRMADLLELGPANFCTGNPNNFAKYAPSFFPWQLCAYQTIYQYYYRLDDKSSFSNTYANLDKWYASSSINLPVGIPYALFFEIHQRPWDFDYFTSMYRSPIVSDANMQSILSSGYGDRLANIYPVSALTNRQSKISESSSVNSNSLIQSFATDPTNNANSTLNVNTANIRQLFANEKLSMITGRTRKNYDSQVLAHYGVNVPHDVKHDITMIHHDEFDLKVLEVTSLASTSDAPLGELAGKSYATGEGQSFKFIAPCDGVVMTIFSIEPKRKYQAAFNRINAVSDVFDLPTPEFDRLGNVPMYRYEAGMAYNATGLAMTDIIGWKERYYSFKRRNPRATYAFFNNQAGTNVWSSYVLNSYPFAVPFYWTGIGSAVYPAPSSEGAFYISRNSMDDLTLVPFVGDWLEDSEDLTKENWSKNPHLVYSRDPFIIDSFIKCKKVSWMSKDGEPVYNMI